ncbi:hypothetical protein BJX96DRAFT_168251 [Aspergillus floccosus]
MDEAVAPNLVTESLHLQLREAFGDLVAAMFPVTFATFSRRVDPDWKVFVQRHAKTQPVAITLSVRCLTTWYLAVRHQDQDKISASRHMYNRALRSLAGLLRNPATITSDTTLACAMTLAVYEMWDGVGPNSWLVHSRGVGALFRLRGPGAHLDGFGRTLFTTYRSFLVADALIHQEPCFMADAGWRQMVLEALAREEREGNASRLVDVTEKLFSEIVLCPGLLKQTRDMIARATLEPSTYMLMSEIRRSQSILKRLRQTLTLGQMEDQWIQEEGRVHSPIGADFVEPITRLSLEGADSALALLNQLLVILDTHKNQCLDPESKMGLSAENPWRKPLTQRAMLLPAGRHTEKKLDDRLDRIVMTMGLCAIDAYRPSGKAVKRPNLVSIAKTLSTLPNFFQHRRLTMVKSYLKFEHANTFGLIASASSNAIWARDDDLTGAARRTGSGRAIVGASEEVLCWDIKKGELLGRWRDSAYGSIRVWDSRTATVIIAFNGHKSAITQLAFDPSGVRLASGSKDTDIILWDLVAEVGQFKLRGHTDQVTSLQFLTPSMDLLNAAGLSEHAGFLLTTGKDSLVKVWDLASQHCIETHVAQSNGECWGLGLSPDQSGCITAGNDGELKVWSIDESAMLEISKEKMGSEDRRVLTERGTFYRNGKDRTIGVSFHPRADYVAFHGSEKAVEIWRIRSETEVQKSLARKRKRRKEREAQRAAEQDGTAPEAETDKPEDIASAPVTEIFVQHVIVRTGGKVRSFDWVKPKSTGNLQLIAATTNNQLEAYSVVQANKKNKDEDDSDYTRSLAVDLPGHRTDIRSVALSSDDRMLASASNGSLKIWNLRTQSCLRTLECGYSLCSAFLPGDKIVVVGNKDGQLEVFDIASSTLLDTIDAHDGPVWSLHVHPDGKSLVSGSADKSAKFWNFQVVQEDIPGTKRTTPRLKLVHTRTLKVSDDILNICFSPDARLLAVALLDNTVKVFFADSLKLFLNLYGHKLPVLNMDISWDSKLIVTCSADKTVRLWGLDFGDCHKAFLAHEDSIMAVAFVPTNKEGNGHNFFSASKDRLIKYWDGDKFEQIQKLPGHHGEIWALAISHNGEFVVSASHDKSIRTWQQTDEPLFLEEEREKELEEMYDNTLTASLEQDEDEDGEKAEAVDAGKQTTVTLMAGEKIMEALDLGMEDLEVMREWRAIKASQPNAAPPSRNPLYMALGNISAEQHVLSVVQKIPAASLQDALLVLPFSKLPALFTFLNIWATREWNIPLTCRVLFFMLKTHHRQIIASKMMRPMLDSIRASLRRVLARQKDEMGFNLSALQFVGRQIKEQSTKDYVDEELWEEQEKTTATGKKRQFIIYLKLRYLRPTTRFRPQCVPWHTSSGSS